MANGPGGHSPERIIRFDVDDGNELDVIGGRVHVTGTWHDDNHQLRAVFAAVAHGDVDDAPAHPWSDPTLTPTQGEVTVDSGGLDGTWNCDAVTARGGCLVDTVIAWGYFQSVPGAEPANLPFKGDSEGTGCSSGSGSGPSGSGQPPGLHYSQAMPRYYRLTPDMASMTLTGAGQNFLEGSSLFSEGVILQFDEDNSTGDAMFWRNMDFQSADAKWALCVGPGAIRLEAVVTMQRSMESAVKSPFVWKCRRWNPSGKTVLHCDVSKVGVGLPSVFVEPVE